MTKKEAEIEEKRKNAVFAKAGIQALGIKTETGGFTESKNGHTPINRQYLNEARLQEHVSAQHPSQVQDKTMDREAKHTPNNLKRSSVPSEPKKSHAGSTAAEKLDAFI